MEPPPIPRPPLQNPVGGTTIDTSPSTLGINNIHSPQLSGASGNSSPDGEPKNLLTRSVDRLSKTLPLEAGRRILSISRKGRDKDKNVEKVPDKGVGKSFEEQIATTHAVSADDHPTPSGPPSRVSVGGLANRFPGDGSMRMGTQALIQALQAIPWEDDRGEDEMGRGPHTAESGMSSEDETDRPPNRLASSIHTIHRPIARSRRGTPATARPFNGVGAKNSYFPTSDDEDIDEVSDDAHEDDFEQSPASEISTTGQPASNVLTGSVINKRVLMQQMGFSRQGSMATVRLKRRARLAEKLREVFGLQELQEVIAEMPCWLLRSVLLQGYLYLTNTHLCFFAHMPSREDQVLKSGSLSKKATRTKRWSKYWFVLKNDVLSWYTSSADPYFPQGNVDLRYAISCEAVDDKNLKIRTNQKSVHLAADSIPSRDEWVKAIRKVIFKAQNHGDSVKISLPYSAILDVEKSSAMDFSATIEVKVVDKDEKFTVDSYFFAYFHNLPQALEQIRECVRAYQHNPPTNISMTVRDTTHRASIASSSPASPPPAGSSLSSRLGLAGLFRGGPFSSEAPASLARTSSAPDPTHGAIEGLTHVVSAPSGTQPMTIQRSPRHAATFGDSSTTPQGLHITMPPNSPPSLAVSDHSYPPGTSPDISTFHYVGSLEGGGPSPGGQSAHSGWTVPAWLRYPSKRIFGSPARTLSYEQPGEVHEVYENVNPDLSRSTVDSTFSADGALEGTMSTSYGGERENQLGFSILEIPSDQGLGLDPVIVEKFKLYFALDEKEQLLGYHPGYLYRLLPLFGRFYISTNYFCFRSSQPLRKTTMIIPLRDIIATQKSRAFSFGHHGLIVVIKGHEELFFEFSSMERRSSIMALLDKQTDELRKKNTASDAVRLDSGQRDALILEELEPDSYLGESMEGPRPPPETETLPAVMFTSKNSTFLAFKPQESLHITCLTIGSRGDCQPYIALCKRLKADGHRCKIATHLEYKDWVEGHGIEFAAVGGDPAELMRICVENGMFTYGFLKETLQKFRGWLDDLLQTSWEACQGTDVLIESPSAMGGIHIAEALRIPYFRAFTMPWSRTRAYPHAFAVPERKMGGGYNYMSYVMFDQVFWRAMAGQINRWRRDALGICSTTFDKLEQHRVPFLYNFSPSIVPPPLDWSEWIKITGYWFLDSPDDSTTQKWSPPPDLVSFIDSAHALGKKVVYIGFGSIVVSDPEAMTKAVVEAIVLSGVYAILSKGWSDRLSTKNSDPLAEVPEVALPPQIYPISSIPHDWLFPRIDAACHHGGAGTTGASLRAGIPTIIKPFFGDQFFWADRVEALDVGSSVRKLTIENLTAALRTATTDVKQIERAKLVGQQIRSENGVDTAVEAIYRNLDYARSIIKHPSSPDHLPAEHNGPVDAMSADRSMEGSADSSHPGGTSDWSVISDEGASPSGSPAISKRSSLTAATLATLHDVLGRPSLGGKRPSFEARHPSPQQPRLLQNP